MPASGAAEDCSGCRKRGIQCDRRRPYCSQCLDNSTDCPGYRTTLTWGVGVASRGKLRGLSLPVANASAATSPPSASSTSRPTPKQPQQRPRANTYHELPSDNDGDESRRKRVRLTPVKSEASYAPALPQQLPPTPHSAVPFTNPFQPPQSPYDHQQQAFAQYDISARHQDLYPLQTSLAPPFHPGAPWGPSLHQHSPSAASLTNSDASFPHTPQPFDPYFPSLAAASAAPGIMPMSANPHTPFGWSQPQFEPSSPDHLSSSTPLLEQPEDKQSSGFDTESARPSMFRAYSAPQMFHFNNHDTGGFEDHSFRNFMPPKSHAMTAEEWFTSMPITSPAFFQLHPRMQYLLNFYDTEICPVLVSQDGPANPYRHHILRLAMHSPGLQSAIAALTTNNMRMRRLKSVPRRADGSIDNERIANTIGAPDAEEQHYKARSIEFLNKQLADPLKAREDSVLATLLILCLFHVCDSGFSKFRTQLAGVQKLIRMRGGMHPRSDFVAWIEAFFAWFDVLTATVNDREPLFYGGASESRSGLNNVAQLSGCDARLMPLFARLSRLNMLSQSRTCTRHSLSGALPTQAPTPGPRPAALPAKDFYSLPRESLEQGELYHSGDLNPLGSPQPRRSTADAAPGVSDTRREFWAEWHALREALVSWQPDGASSQAAAHTSSTFRDAALVYLARLLPGTATNANTRENIASGLAHVRSLVEGVSSGDSHSAPAATQTKFLLWPLFIIGAECTSVSDRALVRSAVDCILAESGFHNNVAMADILERTWAVIDADTASRSGKTAHADADADGEADAEGEEESAGEGADADRPSENSVNAAKQTFAWRSAMDRMDGEYIII